ncbi:glucosamine 6-phosphate synthetase-like amidotransferase/phosphosugar isomerase protein, partial [Rhizobium mongolense]|nr:glucosamine 6-phosphate synthetase-like amidotransferase/phosphosugar isomerase protein [Rhizobium mongolense]
AFTCQLAVLAALAIRAGKARGTVTDDQEQALVKSLTGMPLIMRQVLNSIKPKIELLSRELSKCRTCSISAAARVFP